MSEITDQQIEALSKDLEYVFTKTYERMSELVKDLIEADAEQRPQLLKFVKKVQDKMDQALFLTTQAEKISKYLEVRKGEPTKCVSCERVHTHYKTYFKGNVRCQICGEEQTEVSK